MIVTISASYAAGGSEIAPQVADRLGVTFVDRAIPVAVAQDLGISVEEAEAVEQNSPSRFWSLFATLSVPSGGMVVPGSDNQLPSERELLDRTETRIRELADEGSCVILGHAAALVLADRADALHVRLDGAPDGRVRAAMRQHGIGQDEASAAQRKNDKIRTGYVRHFYQADSSDPRHYHLVLDTVRLGWGAAEDLIVAAARAVATAG